MPYSGMTRLRHEGRARRGTGRRRWTGFSVVFALRAARLRCRAVQRSRQRPRARAHRRNWRRTGLGLTSPACGPRARASEHHRQEDVPVVIVRVRLPRAWCISPHGATGRSEGTKGAARAPAPAAPRVDPRTKTITTMSCARRSCLEVMGVLRVYARLWHPPRCARVQVLPARRFTREGRRPTTSSSSSTAARTSASAQSTVSSSDGMLGQWELAPTSPWAACAFMRTIWLRPRRGSRRHSEGPPRRKNQPIVRNRATTRRARDAPVC